MEHDTSRTIPRALRAFLALFWGGVCAGFLAAPLLEALGHSPAAAFLYALFSPVCHQNPERSFSLFGHPWAVCHRCSGIYLGLFLASFLPFELGIVRSPNLRRLWVACATAPMLFDVFLQLTGIWSGGPASRFATGLVFGAMLSSLLAPGLVDFLKQPPWRRNRLNTGALGGLS